MSTTTIGDRYRLGHLLGQGGMGRVWAAHDDLLDREVAVKEVLLPPHLPDDERAALLVRTLREAQAVARVRHPNVVSVFDVVEHDGRPWLVLQLLAPRTLADVLAECGSLEPAAAARIGLDLLDGLAAVHAAGVVHRDVKPGNVLFGADGAAVLTDFGIASLDGDPGVTSTGLVLGSPAYLAPERARGGVPTPASDLWSLGATLFAAVEGEAPFHRDGPLPTLGALLTEDVPPALNAGPLAPALAALLTKDPQTRTDAAGVRPLLEQALTGRSDPTLTLSVPALAAGGTAGSDPDPTVGVSTTASTTAGTAAAAPRPRRRLVLAAAALVAVALPIGALASRGPAAGGAAADTGVVQVAPGQQPTVKPSTPRPSSPTAAPVSRASSPVRSPQPAAARPAERPDPAVRKDAKGKDAKDSKDDDDKDDDRKDDDGKDGRTGKGGGKGKG